MQKCYLTETSNPYIPCKHFHIKCISDTVFMTVRCTPSLNWTSISLLRYFLRNYYLNRSANRCWSLVTESSFFLQFFVEFTLGCIFKDEINTGGVVEITIQPQNMRMPASQWKPDILHNFIYQKVNILTFQSSKS